MYISTIIYISHSLASQSLLSGERQDCPDRVRALRRRVLPRPLRVQHHFGLLHRLRLGRLHSAALALERALAEHRGRGGRPHPQGRPDRPRSPRKLRGYLGRAGARHFGIHL